MERNWDTIREILLGLEEKRPDKHTLRLSDFPTNRAAEISYHVELLMEAGLIHGQMSKTLSPDPSDFMAIRLTWSGHELLDAIKSDTIWRKTKESFISKGVSMTFDLVKSVAIDISAAYIKGHIGA